MVSGGHILVKALQAHNVDTVFCVAGESYLPVLDAVLDFPDIKVVTCRHESGATFMAEAYAQLTGKPGIAFVTRGPGACNGSIGIHAAHQSSTPVILFVGLINTADRDRESFQEFDLPQMFDSLSKWAANIDRAERIAEYTTRAMHLAASGRPGPVVLGLPEEILVQDVEDLKIKPVPYSESYPSDKDMGALREMLAVARRPLILVGGGGWRDQDCKALADFAESSGIAVATSLRRQDVFDHGSDQYIGELGFGPNPALVERIKTADVVLVLGTRIDEITSIGYTLLQPEQKLIHVCSSVSEFGKPYVPDLGLRAHVAPVVGALANGPKIDGSTWQDWCREARQDYLDWTRIDSEKPAWKGADMTQVFRQLRDLLPDDAVITTDAGNFSGWCQRYLRYGRPGRLMAPISGSMGYGVPAALAAAIQYPDRLTLGVCGDGGFMMTGQELATAAHHGAKPIIMVCNNSMYGTIRMHQERDYPGRVSGTDLTNPDFVKLAESYGAFAARIEDADDFTGVWNEALKADKPALIEIRQDPRQISTTTKL